MNGNQLRVNSPSKIMLDRLKSKNSVLCCTNFFKLDYMERFQRDDVIYLLKKQFEDVEDSVPFVRAADWDRILTYYSSPVSKSL